MSTLSASIHSLTLVYEKEGSGSPIVFFPGAFCSAIQWERTTPFLLSDYTCYALEPRGHGRSDHAADGDYRWTTFLADAATFIADVVGQPAILVGHSFGGAVAMGLAAHHPELVRAVYVEDVVPANIAGDLDAPALLATLSAVADLLEDSKTNGWSSARFAAAMALAFPAWAKMDPNRLAGQARMWFGTDPVFGRAAVNNANGCDLAEAAAIEKRIRCPLHIAQADKALGGIVTDAHLQNVRESSVNFTTTYFPGADHGITVTQLKPFLADLRAFLARVEVQDER